jgi:hypothetical protein
MTATWADTDVRDQVEHECPQRLRYRADEFDDGGMVFTPAGRWETIVAVDAPDRPHITVRTDRAVWRFLDSDEMPYLPACLAGNASPVRVAVYEGSTSLTVYIGRGRRHYDEHTLINAFRGKGGWRIYDRPDGATPEHVDVDSRAKARTEVARRAKAHANRLGLPYAPAEPRS